MGSPADDEGISQAQYLCLLETRWVRPIPVAVSKANIGLKKVDVIHTRLEGRNIDYSGSEDTSADTCRGLLRQWR
jgi:hypothetical protein